MIDQKKGTLFLRIIAQSAAEQIVSNDNNVYNVQLRMKFHQTRNQIRKAFVIT